ncbi:hypothetical protein VNO78_00773 [Psophocarpus tetragonolobus]|uniref:Uncharacterized protein n=1 Tax=Psophocarpus tetragonolobus TaxID=3891 RepID=A0AAN9T8E9_PSOTE
MHFEGKRGVLYEGHVKEGSPRDLLGSSGARWFYNEEELDGGLEMKGKIDIDFEMRLRSIFIYGESHRVEERKNTHLTVRRSEVLSIKLERTLEINCTLSLTLPP